MHIAHGKASNYKIEVKTNYLRWIIPCVEYESGIDDRSRQWEDIERSVYEMIPASCDI